jgi:fumarylpyruvate hydrolase
MSYVFPPAPRVSVPVAGGTPFSRYAGSTASAATTPTTPPKWGQIPASHLFSSANRPMHWYPAAAMSHYPPATSNLQHEVELVVALRDGGADILPERALEYVYGYAVGLDLTRRDLQQLAKDKGHPWDMGKGFDQSAPIGAIHPLAALDHPTRGSIWLKVNGQLRQTWRS